VACWQMFNKWILKSKAEQGANLICGLYQFVWYKYSYKTHLRLSTKYVVIKDVQ
jgi:hypothetical protein